MPLASVSPNHLTDSAHFEREAEVVLRELRPALADIIERLEPPVRRVTDLQRLLNLSYRVSWTVFSAATARDARLLPSLLPRRRGMDRFFVAARAHGVAPEAIERAERSFERFERLVAQHAGGRDAFQSMIAELGGRAGRGGRTAWDDAGAELKHKRAAFRAMSLLCGRQARAMSQTMIIQPGDQDWTEDGDVHKLLDAVTIVGFSGLHRTRRAVPLHIMQIQRSECDPGPAPPQEPLDPRARGEEPKGLGRLHDFCSRPLPDFRLLEARTGFNSYELVSDTLGPSGEVTWFTGHSIRGVASPPNVPSGRVTVQKEIVVPAEVFIGDFVVHRSVCDTTPPTVRVYGAPAGGAREVRESDLMPVVERAEYLGEGIDAARTPHIPRYAELLAYAMKQMGWNGDDFRVFRCEVRYPVLHWRIRMSMGKREERLK